MEPWFTFEAHIPPRELRRMTVRQVRAHLLWWETNRGPLELSVTKGR